VPINAGVTPIHPEQIREIVEYIRRYRSSEAPFDVCKLGLTPGKDLSTDKAKVEAYIPAGLTWWLEEIYPSRGSIKQVRERIRVGPPR
jgi:hypothetical protein